MDKEETKFRLENRISNLKESLKKARQSIRQLDKGQWFYRIVLHSLWSHYGEKTVTLDGEFKEPIESVVEKAEKEFKKVNSRSDIQARRMALIVFKNDENLMIDYPKK